MQLNVHLNRHLLFASGEMISANSANNTCKVQRDTLYNYYMTSARFYFKAHEFYSVFYFRPPSDLESEFLTECTAGYECTVVTLMPRVLSPCTSGSRPRWVGGMVDLPRCGRIEPDFPFKRDGFKRANRRIDTHRYPRYDRALVNDRTREMDAPQMFRPRNRTCARFSARFRTVSPILNTILALRA